jgi:hypothetical protein
MGYRAMEKTQSDVGGRSSTWNLTGPTDKSSSNQSKFARIPTPTLIALKLVG